VKILSRSALAGGPELFLSPSGSEPAPGDPAYPYPESSISFPTRYATGPTCGRSNRPALSVASQRLRANEELLTKLHAAVREPSAPTQILVLTPKFCRKAAVPIPVWHCSPTLIYLHCSILQTVHTPSLNFPKVYIPS